MRIQRRNFKLASRIKTKQFDRSLKLTIEIKIMKSLDELIDTYKDYPKEGVEFKDVLGIIQEPKVFK